MVTSQYDAAFRGQQVDQVRESGVLSKPNPQNLQKRQELQLLAVWVSTSKLHLAFCCHRSCKAGEQAQSS